MDSVVRSTAQRCEVTGLGLGTVNHFPFVDSLKTKARDPGTFNVGNPPTVQMPGVVARYWNAARNDFLIDCCCYIQQSSWETALFSVIQTRIARVIFH